MSELFEREVDVVVVLDVGLPVVVDFPESTWPITTTLMCIFSLLQRRTR